MDREPQITFRDVDPDEAVNVFVTLWNREYPDFPESKEAVASALRHLTPGAVAVHRVGYLNGLPIACLMINSVDDQKPVRLDGELAVDPSTAGPATFAAVVELRKILADHGLDAVSVWGGDRVSERESALAASGFEVIQTVPVSHLDLDGFDPSPFEEKAARVRERYRICSAADLDDEGFDWIPGLWETATVILEDVPNPHPVQKPTLEEYRRRIREETVFYQLDTMMIALDGTTVIGYSRVTSSDAKPDLASTGLSGTLRDYRRQGIVTALKLEGIERMRRKGIRWLQTDNDETNPMLDFNRQLGFTHSWKWRRWELKTAKPD